MDERRVFDSRGANHGLPIKREILPPNQQSILVSKTAGFCQTLLKEGVADENG